MNNNFTERLIALYAVERADSILNNRNDVYTKSFPDAEQLMKDPLFSNIQNEVASLKKLIEYDLLKRTASTAALQTHEALKYMLDLSLFTFVNFSRGVYLQKMELTKNLIRAIYKGWSTDLIDHFEDRYKWIVRDKHVFISYSNRTAKDVNRKYSDLIKAAEIRHKESYAPTEKDWQEKNLIARLFVLTLTSCSKFPAGRLFFDCDDLMPGDKLQQTILPIAGSCYQLVQLITDGIFSYYVDNWPYQEYISFSNDDPEAENRKRPQKALIFSILGDRVPPVEDYAPQTFVEWNAAATQVTKHQVVPRDLDSFTNSAKQAGKAIKTYLYDTMLAPIETT